MRFICRFAPSPNGRLHLGHALSAFINADAADEAGGDFLLRIEDIDATRSRPAFEQAIRADLDWLGIRPAATPRRQSEHLAFYVEALDRLERDGLLYPAFESRTQVAHAVAQKEAEAPWPRDPDGAPLYPFARHTMTQAERNRLRSEGAPFVLRLDMAAALARIGGPLAWREARETPLGPAFLQAADPAAWGDVVVARKDVPVSYHLAVVLDDAAQAVSHVIRGRDLFAATSVHRVLQELLGLAAPIYHHHRLVLGADGRKLSKSEGAASLDYLRQAGEGPADIRRRLGLSA
ncbi:MAG: tRNA glutamyl-Q(34) synthetase GluQRS [Rhizobiales bacterium 24-66-13]|jgi:glutamyl-Q tRNA(Asp) synthetase|nr:MAG: tRNA glutamyl-Q(34) synthetase GluQRS [Rhizobiales bacterium 24-66-13]OZA95885.1 MAG: tRNA glutamyl-Q(34) synthetase GluQRS [Rhizobiales bacterium 39-66-18]HQS07231.1 tRNA glutamyl-Q(34) synthetase GluQRS [Xanthobacteraceae bacterium]